MSVILIAGGGTGGHLMPALAIADAIRERHADWTVVLVGAQRGIEAQLLPARSHRYHLLPAEPLHRRQWWRNLRWPVLAVRLLRGTAAILDRERPAAVLGTGGYASGPVVWLAARRGIPTAIFEPDARPGLTSRLLSRRVREVYLGVPEAERALRFGPRTQVRVTGPPIIPPDPTAATQGRAIFAVDAARPVVLVTGGSQGALALNEIVGAWIRSGRAASVQVIWATGAGSYDRFRALHQPPGVHVSPFLDPIAPAYAIADLAVTRAGMMTIAELCAWGLPSILVPLPTAAQDHQTHNARVMSEAGAAVHVPQRDLNPDRLASEVESLAADSARRAALGGRAKARGKPQATAEIRGHLERLIGSD
jgi:UDP-N-acetylglucosamine--N-acetylmuramyl-(pentapeptide) pyrophosphoryl-undecaprenol N-acetylglucosamine transferase